MFLRAENPIRISATGPDGAGKDTAWRNAKKLLPTDLLIVKIGKPSSIIRDGEEIYVHTEMSKFLDSMHTWADSKRSKLLTSLANTAYVLFQWRVQEPLLVAQNKPDMVFSLRDGYVDPAAYAPYYMPATLGKLTIPNRILALRAMHGSPMRQHTIFMDISPKVAVERIAARIDAENHMEKKPLRPKWQHQHENETDLRAIRQEYFGVLDHLSQKYGTRISVIDTTLVSRQEVGNFLSKSIIESLPRKQSVFVCP